MTKIYSELKFDTCLIFGILQYKTIFCFVINNVINDAEINVAFLMQFFAVFYLVFFLNIGVVIITLLNQNYSSIT